MVFFWINVKLSLLTRKRSITRRKKKSSTDSSFSHRNSLHSIRHVPLLKRIARQRLQRTCFLRIRMAIKTVQDDSLRFSDIRFYQSNSFSLPRWWFHAPQESHSWNSAIRSTNRWFATNINLAMSGSDEVSVWLEHLPAISNNLCSECNLLQWFQSKYVNLSSFVDEWEFWPQGKHLLWNWRQNCLRCTYWVNELWCQLSLFHRSRLIYSFGSISH